MDKQNKIKKLFPLLKNFGWLNYNRHSIIKEKRLGIGDEWVIRSTKNMVVFVLEGKITCKSNQSQAAVFTNGVMFFIPEKCRELSFMSSSETLLLIISLQYKVTPLDCFDLDDLQQMEFGMKMIESVPFSMAINSALRKYLDMLLLFNRQGLRYPHYNDDKLKELMLILKAFYPKEDLYKFFFSFKCKISSRGKKW